MNISFMHLRTHDVESVLLSIVIGKGTCGPILHLYLNFISIVVLRLAQLVFKVFSKSDNLIG